MAASSGLSITAAMAIKDPAIRHMVKIDTANLDDGRSLSRFMVGNKDGGSSAAMANPTTMLRGKAGDGGDHSNAHSVTQQDF